VQHDLIVSPNIDSFDVKKRIAALAGIVREAGPQKCIDPASGGINMHIHSFYSYNSVGYSPAHIALECRRNGLYAAALCDFDVLDGLEEFLTAGQMLGLRAAVHLETRAFLKEYSVMEINSPGEPGVTYIMGAGFGRLPSEKSNASSLLKNFRQQANTRNRDLVKRINRHLPEIAIDYDAVVLPMSPGKCPTERHIIKAYRLEAQKLFPHREGLLKYWSKLFKKPLAEVEILIDNTAAMEDKLRSLLAKKGGLGYVQPGEKTFPLVDDFIAWVLKCGAIPMVTWLDGTSRGEEDMLKMLECMKTKGAAALNIIPERNHNIKNAEERRLKLRKLDDVVAAAQKIKFPINIGTEMNKVGQPFADDLECEALKPYRADFLRGANIMVGQTILTRYANFSYCGKAATAEFGKNIARKNDFFEKIGKLPPLNKARAEKLEKMGFAKALRYLCDSSARGGGYG